MDVAQLWERLVTTMQSLAPSPVLRITGRMTWSGRAQPRRPLLLLRSHPRRPRPRHPPHLPHPRHPPRRLPRHTPRLPPNLRLRDLHRPLALLRCLRLRLCRQVHKLRLQFEESPTWRGVASPSINYFASHNQNCTFLRLCNFVLFNFRRRLSFQTVDSIPFHLQSAATAHLNFSCCNEHGAACAYPVWTLAFFPLSRKRCPEDQRGLSLST